MEKALTMRHNDVYSTLVGEPYHHLRIDKFLSIMLPPSGSGVFSRSFVQKAIRDGLVTANGQAVRNSYRVSAGETVVCHVPAVGQLSVEAQDLPLDVVYEDDDVIIVNKAKGVVVHPAAGHHADTLVNALLYHCRDSLSGINGVLRPGIVHRIDKDTTGLLVACKNDFAHQNISEQLKSHSITRKYDALVHGVFPDGDGMVEGAVGRHPVERKKMAVNVRNGKPAVTRYHIVEAFGTKYTHIECVLETGRTHQIRVHLSHIGHPLLGDAVYGAKRDGCKTVHGAKQDGCKTVCGAKQDGRKTAYGAKQDGCRLEGQALHARVLGFVHPRTGEYMEFEAPLPDYFVELVERLRLDSNRFTT